MAVQADGMLSLEIKADMREANKALSRIERDVVPRAAAAALNQTRTAVAKAAVKTAAKDIGAAPWAIRRRYLKQGLRRARPNSLRVVFYVGTLAIALDKTRTTKRGKAYAFGPPQEEARGLSFGPYYVQSAFLAPMDTGHIGAFERHGAKRIATKGRYAGQLRQRLRKPKAEIGKDLEQATDKAIDTKGAETWRESFPKHWRKQLKRAMK